MSEDVPKARSEGLISSRPSPERDQALQKITSASGVVHAPLFVAGDYVVESGLGPPAIRLDDADFRARVGPPLPPSPLFAGRDAEIEQIASVIDGAESSPSLVAVTGLGGLGKTEIAIEFAARRASSRPVYWVNASSRINAVTQFTSLATLLGMSGRRTIGATIELVRSELGNRDALVVFDGAESADAIQDLIPTVGTAKVLVTSTRPDWRHLGDVVELGQLDPEIAVSLLLNRADQADEGSARQIANALGNLPLGLIQAGAYCEQTGFELGALAEQLLRDRPLLWRLPPSERSKSSIESVWSLALASASEQSIRASLLIQMLAFGRPAGTGLARLRSSWTFASPQSGAAEAPSAANDAFRALRSYSLVSARSGNVVIHPLLAEFVRKSTPSPARVKTIRLLLSAATSGLPSHPWRTGSPALSLECADEVLTLSKYAADFGLDLRVASDAFERAAALFAYWWMHDEAVRLGTAALDAGRISHRGLIRLAHELRRAGETDSATERFEQLLEKAPNLKSSGMPGTGALDVLVAYASQLAETQRWDEAMEWFQVALVELEQRYGRPSTEFAKVSGRFAAALRRKGEYGRSIAVFEEALAELRSLGHFDTLELALTCGSLGRCFTEAGFPDRAVPLATEAVRIKRRLVPPGVPLGHPRSRDLAQSLIGLASAQAALADADQCLAALGEAEEIVGATFPTTHAQHSQLEVVRAQLAYAVGDYEKAQNHALQAVSLAEANPGRFDQELVAGQKVLTLVNDA